MTWKHGITENFRIVLLGLLGFSTVACNTHGKVDRTKPKNPVSTASSPMQRQLDGGSYCVQILTQGPIVSTPIHFSNKETLGDGSSKDFESDLVGDKLDVTVHERHPATDFDRELNTVRGAQPIPIRDGLAESVRTNHYNRSDAQGWTMGPNSVALGATPWGLFVDKPTVTAVGTEVVAGFETTKYSVDTRQQSTMDKAALLAAGRLKDYNITGTAWVLRDKNCILQYSIDFEQDEIDGKVSKTHYQGTVTKQ
jgi:hypothetical protein